MDEWIVIVVGVAIIVALVFVLVRGWKKTSQKYKNSPQRKITKSQAIAALGLFWSTTVYFLKFNMGIDFGIAILATTVVTIVLYQIIKKDFKNEVKKN